MPLIDTSYIKRYAHLLVYPIIAASILSIYTVVEQNLYASDLSRQRNEVRAVASEVRTGLERVLLSNILLAQGLASVLSVEPDLSQTKFSNIAQGLRKQNESIINIAVLEGYVITRVFPLDQNKDIVGLDIHNTEGQAEMARLSAIHRAPAIDGPVSLLQGGTGFIVRAPVFLAVDGAFWGFATVVIDADQFFRRAGLYLDRPDVEFAVRHVRPDGTQDPAFWGLDALFESASVFEGLNRPTGNWQIAVAPKTGWVTRSDYVMVNQIFFLALGIFVALVFWFVRKQRLLAKKSYERLLDAIECLPAGFVIYDENGLLTGYNKAFCDIFEKCAPAVRLGATSDEIMRFGVERGQFPDAVGREEEWLHQLNNDLKNNGFEWEYRISDCRWIKSYNQKTREGGRVGIRVDVTELRKQQTNLAKTNRELQKAIATREAAEQRFADITTMSSDWFWEQDADGRFTFLSEGFSRATGIQVESVVGKTRAEAFQIDTMMQSNGDWDYLAELTSKHLPFRDFVYTLKGVQKKDVSLRIAGLPYDDQNGKFAGYRGVGSDVSILANALRKAEESSAVKSEFLSVVSHELRSPLTSILGFNAFLMRPNILRSVVKLRSHLKGGDTKPQAVTNLVNGATTEIATYAKKVDASGQHLLKLIDDMLNFSAIDSEVANVVSKKIELDGFVADVVHEFSDAAQKKGLTLIHDVGNDKILADKLLLRRILFNLIENAIKFTKQGSIHITSKRVGNNVQIRIKDTGVGIPSEFEESVFDHFRQVDKAGIRSEGGLGLGLTIVKKLVNMQGGSILLNSTPGEGTIFTLSFPAATDTAPAD